MITIDVKEDGKEFYVAFDPPAERGAKRVKCADISRVVVVIKHYYGIPHPKRHCVLCQEKDHEAKAILARPRHP